ncbi:MAG TPA: hypothetical protein VGY53_12335 [Isosphaeraceae bacterium]|nr:hypothetical protein [Isosphaeraceae bacterium]
MSDIFTAQTGEDLVCIQRFTAWPKGEESALRARRTFRMGERVRYIGFFQDPKLKQSPEGWKVLFEVRGSKRPRQFATTQANFVTGANWERLRKFFARRIAADMLPRIIPIGKKGPAGPKTNGHKKFPPKRSDR